MPAGCPHAHYTVSLPQFQGRGIEDGVLLEDTALRNPETGFPQTLPPVVQIAQRQLDFNFAIIVRTRLHGCPGNRDRWPCVLEIPHPFRARTRWPARPAASK